MNDDEYQTPRAVDLKLTRAEWLILAALCVAASVILGGVVFAVAVVGRFLWALTFP